MEAAPLPILIGGTGRSGTTAVARLLGAHRDLVMIEREARFHADRRGLVGLLRGRVRVETFVRRVENLWAKPSAEQRDDGFGAIAEPEVMASLLEAFAGDYPHDPVGAAGRLVRALFDPIAREAGASAWVEHTPRNAEAAASLIEVLPDLRLVVVLRSGLDTACSMVTRPWGRAGVPAAIREWAARVAAIHRSIDRLPSDQVLVILLEDLVERRREETYGALRDFLDLDDDPRMRDVFEQHIVPSEASLGRWRHDVPAASQPLAQRIYLDVLDRLMVEGVPVERYVPEPLDEVRSQVAESIDAAPGTQEVIDAYRDELSEALAALEAAQRQIEEVRLDRHGGTDRTALREALRRRGEKTRALQQRLAAAQRRLEETEQRLGTARQRATAERAERQRLQAELTKLRREVVSLRERNRALRETTTRQGRRPTGKPTVGLGGDDHREPLRS